MRCRHALRRYPCLLGKDRELKKFGCLPESAEYIPSAVVIMTTADGTHPTFFRKAFDTFLCPISTDLYRLLMEVAEVHHNPVTLINHFIHFNSPIRGMGVCLGLGAYAATPTSELA